MNLFTDDPIQNKKQDKLQREPFANRIAELCERVHEQGESSVIALIGPWGSGKSSVLNLVKASLSKKETWRVGEFNPWLLSDIESLVQTFFGELRELLPPGEQAGSVRDKLREYGNYVSPALSALKLVGLSLPDEVKEMIEAWLKGDTSLSKRKQEIEDALKTANTPILVIIDDLDRLEPDELMMVFKLVRLVGRLPNVYYLLSYDEQTLLDVITQTELAKGDKARAHDYLEKIVQLRLDLPPLHTSQQLKLINAAFDEVTKRNKITISDDDQKIIQEAYNDVQRHYLDEPRAINRYFAQVDALFPLVTGEVNFVDFMLVTFLRTEFPRVHKLLLKHKDELVNSPSFELRFGEREKHEATVKRWGKYLEDAGCKEPGKILKLLGLMFLPIKSALSNSNYGSTFYEDMRRAKRIGSPDYFDRYFQFGVPETDIADAELEKKVAELKSSKKQTATKAGAWIVSKLKSDPALLLRKLSSMKDSASFPAAETLVTLAAGYNAMPENSGFLGLDAKWDVIRLARRLMMTVLSDDREVLVDKILQAEAGLYLMADLVDTAIPDTKQPEPDVEKVNNELLKLAGKTKDALVKHLDELAKKQVSDASDSDRTAFYRLMRIDGPDIQRITWEFHEKSKWPLVEFAGWFVPTSTIWGDGTVRKGVGEVSTATLDQLFGLDKLIEKLKPELDSEPVEVKRDATPDLENKKQLVLNILRDVRSQREKEEKA